MTEKLYYNTVKELLLSVLKQVMEAKEFSVFRLVGGTALSLQLGHRLSVDIDLFTDSSYGLVDFNAIDNYFRSRYPYVETSRDTELGFGKSYNVGEREDTSIKLDVFYTDTFMRPAKERDGIRMADMEDIIAMKLEIISNGGRMKDFWDVHELANHYSFHEMLSFHKERYPYTHDVKSITQGFSNFTRADNDLAPECLRGKHWEVIKLDLIDFASSA